MPSFPRSECPQVAKTWATADGLGFCLGIDRDLGRPLCRLVTIATGRHRITRVRRPLIPRPASDGRLRPFAGGVEVCLGSTRCRRISATPKGVTPARSDLALNPAGTRLAVIAGKNANSVRMVSVYDVPKGKLLWRKPSGDECANVRWLGDALLVNSDVCAGPSGQSWLADPDTGARRTWIGGAHKLNTYGEAPVYLSGRLWAWIGIRGKDIVIHDVGTASMVRTISLAHLRDKVDLETEVPCEFSTPAIVSLPGSDLAVVFAPPRAGEVVLFDYRAGRQKKHLKPQACP